MTALPAPRFRIPRDVWIGLLTLALGVWYWRAAGEIPISPLDGVVNATALPRALAYAMIGFSLLLILRAMAIELIYLRAAREALELNAAKTPERPRPEGIEVSPGQHVKAAGVVAMGLLFLLALPWLGYVPSVILLVGAMSIYIGARAGLYTLAVAVAVAVAFYLLFVVLFDIPLPAGIWPRLLG